MRLEATPVRPFSWTYRFHDFRGEIATVDFAALRLSGELPVGSERHLLRSERPGGPWVLEGSGRLLARARRSALHGWFEFEYAGRHATAEPASRRGRAYVVNEGAARIGAVRRRTRWFRRRLEIELPADLPLAVQVFITWLVLLQVRRREIVAPAWEATVVR